MLCRNPECNAEVNPEALFCGKCGTPVLSACTVCGASIPAKRNAKWCPQCGTMISEMRAKARSGTESTVSSAAAAPVRVERDDSRAAEAVRMSPVDSSLHLRSEPVYVGSSRSVSGSAAARPVDQIKTNRSLGMFILLSLVTFGIYSIIFFTKIGTDLNKIAGRHDGKKTMHFCLMLFVITPITLGIGGLVWYHNMSDRVGTELRRRGYEKTIGSDTFWLWSVLGSLLFGIGPFVYIYKLAGAMNTLAEDYNARG